MKTVIGYKVVYSEKQWRTLARLRAFAVEMISPLVNEYIDCIVYGSIARGDISKTSDIDVYIPNPPSPTIIEVILEEAGIKPVSREIIQATPSYAAKAYIYLDELRGFSFPLVSLRQSEEDFTGFAGRLTYTQLMNDERVPGVNKDLILIDPVKEGHLEYSIHGIEGIVAKKLSVDTRIVHQRIKILKRREKVGKTGVYIKRELAPDESFSAVFNEIKLSNSAIRRRLRKNRGYLV